MPWRTPSPWTMKRRVQQITFGIVVEKFRNEENKNRNCLAMKFDNFKMVESKPICSQLQEYLHTRTQLENEGIPLPDRFVVPLLLNWLTLPWQSFINDHRKRSKEAGLKELVYDIWDEDEIFRQSKPDITMKLQMKANISEALPVKPGRFKKLGKKKCQ